MPKVEEWETVGDRGFRWSGSLSAAAMVVVVMLICSAVYAWLQRPKSAVATPAAAPVHTAAAPVARAGAAPCGRRLSSYAATGPDGGAEAGGGQTARHGSAEQAGRELSRPTTSRSKRKPAAPNPDATVHVQITADEAVWVMARTDGKYAFSATLNPGDTRSVEA